MFNSHSNFKSSTSAAYNAVKSNSKLSLTQFREELAKNTPFGSTAAYKASFKNDSVAPIEQKNTLNTVFIVTEKRDERLYTSAYVTYNEALMHIKKDLIEDIEDKDVVSDFFNDIVTIHSSDETLKNLDSLENIINEMNEELLVKVHAWLYQDESPIIQINSSSIDGSINLPIIESNTSHAPQGKEEIIDLFFGMPEVFIAEIINRLCIMEVIYLPQHGFTNYQFFPYNIDYLVSMVEEYAENKTEEELRLNLSAENQYILMASHLEYSVSEKDYSDEMVNDLPNEWQVSFLAKDVDESNLMESLTSLLSKEVHRKTSLNLDSSKLIILRCSGQKIFRMNAQH